MAQTAEEIAAVLRERIQRGELQPGDRLPTMDALADEYDVNRQTARQALNLLKTEGLVEYKGGRAGTFVRERPTARMVRSRGMERDSMGYYSGANVQHWKSIGSTQVTTGPVPADIAGYLGIEPGTPVIARKRLNGDPDVPVYRQLTDSYLHPAAVEAIPVIGGNSGRGGIYDRIEEHYQQPILWEEETTAATPNPAEAAALLLPAGVALLRVIRLSTVKAGGKLLVVEVNDIRMSAELFSVRYPLTRKGAARWPVQPASADFYTS